MGGNFGLFVGMSILSVIELFEFLVEFVRYLLSKRNKIKQEAESKRASIFLLVENAEGGKNFFNYKWDDILKNINERTVEYLSWNNKEITLLIKRNYWIH